jgi:hypothetical protein
MRCTHTISLFLLAVAACSDSNGGTPDANLIHPDTAIDAPPPPPGCDYGELHDDTNDDISSNTGLPETTGVSFSTSTVLCGKIHATHFDGTQMLVDSDAYTIDVAADSSVRVTLTGAGAEALGDVTVYIEDGADTFYAGTFFTNHATTNAQLAAGSYKITVVAGNDTALAADIDYKVKITTDDPTTRCTKATTAANYAEAHDGPGSTGNDMVAVNFLADPARALTTAADVPEPSAITAMTGMKYRISGASANVDAADEYHDRDAYLFTTGPTTNELSVRLNWASTMTDLDLLVFPAGNVTEIGASALVGNTEDEFTTFAVKPNADYWLWVGAYDDPAGVYGVPYDATICADAFVP